MTALRPVLCRRRQPTVSPTPSLSLCNSVYQSYGIMCGMGAQNMKRAFRRAFRSLIPLRRVPRGRLAPVDIARRHGRGNVLLQLGRVKFADEYRAIRARVLAYAF